MSHVYGVEISQEEMHAHTIHGNVMVGDDEGVLFRSMTDKYNPENISVRELPNMVSPSLSLALQSVTIFIFNMFEAILR